MLMRASSIALDDVVLENEEAGASEAWSYQQLSIYLYFLSFDYFGNPKKSFVGIRSIFKRGVLGQ